MNSPFGLIRRVGVAVAFGAVAVLAVWELKSFDSTLNMADKGLSAIYGQDDAWNQSDKTVRGNPAIDRSGGARVGKASFYADSFAGRKMADGEIMDPEADNAASRTLPLGTTARVTNLNTGKSAVITIQDRGPYVGGRIVDLSPSTAHKIGITRQQGVANVAVAPIAVPLPDGRIRLGAGATEPRFAANASLPANSSR